jgi:peptide deformylase
MILSIIKEPDSRLNQVSVPLTDEDFNTLSSIVDDMYSLMKSANGVGLAAPQVGILKRYFVAIINGQNMFFGNPVIIDSNDGFSILEGCLSVPNMASSVPRKKYIELQYLDLNNSRQIIKLSNFESIIVQHEIDHLNGVTLYSRASKSKKSTYLKGIKHGNIKALGKGSNLGSY